MRNRCLWILLCIFVLSVLPAMAQTQAAISGVIRDSSGAIIPGATVTVTNPATNLVRSAISNEAGSENFPALPPSQLHIQVRTPGFPTIHKDHAHLPHQPR